MHPFVASPKKGQNSGLYKKFGERLGGLLYITTKKAYVFVHYDSESNFLSIASALRWRDVIVKSGSPRDSAISRKLKWSL